MGPAVITLPPWPACNFSGRESKDLAFAVVSRRVTGSTPQDLRKHLVKAAQSGAQSRRRHVSSGSQNLHGNRVSALIATCIRVTGREASASAE